MIQEKQKIKMKDLLDSQSLPGDFFSWPQRFIYETAGLYAMSMDLEENVLADVSYSDEKEGQYVRTILNETLLQQVVHEGENNMLEQVFPVAIEDVPVACDAFILRLAGRPRGVMCFLGFIEEEAGDGLPAFVKHITREKYDYFVQLVGSQMNSGLKMAETAYTATLEAEMAKQSEAKMEEDFIRSTIITEIVQMMESEEEIVDVIAKIIRKVCQHLSIDMGCLSRINSNRSTVSVISEWSEDAKDSLIQSEQNKPIKEYPFMKRENYIISSGTALNDEQKGFMEKYGLKAFVVLPIYLGDEVIMYLQFGCKNRECQWEIETIRFLSNVRKIVQSIITKRVTQNSLTSSISALEGIMENLGCGVMVVRPQNRQVLFANHLLSREMHETFEKLDLRKLFPEGMNSTEHYIGSLQKWMLLYRATISWVDGNEVELYSFYDITKNKTVENDYKKSTTSDFLTGLYNRKRCEEDLASYLEMTKQGNGKGALLFIDLDDFKRINDGLGHQYGDILLKAISSNLRRVPGIENSCYRVGGDEFMVIVSGIQYERLDEIVESISEIFKYPWFLKGHDYYCNMSMGVTRFPRDASTVEDVIRCVDAALYDAKKKGKNQVKFFDRNDNDTDNFMRLDMEKFIRDACTNIQEEFEVYYQPIIDISLPGDPCVGAEALLRWNSKEMGEISPADFVPLAEYLGLIKPIGEHVLRTACKECKRWNDMGHPNYKVNVNFSVVQLLQQDIQNVITDVLAETGLEPHNLTIEVTESLAINDLAYMKQVLNSIRRIGVRVALDDFGTGYSSLNHIHEMPIDIIKVDRCFVQNIGEEEYSQVFVRMVSELAKTMKMNVCVEGVETDAQYKIMKKHNINMIQGYYFAEPMPAKEFELKFTE